MPDDNDPPCGCDEPDLVFTDTGVWCDECDTRVHSGFVL